MTAAMLLVCLTAPTAFGADGDDKVVKAVNGDLLKGLLEEEGFRGVTVEKINLTTHAVMVRMNGRTVVFLCDLDKGCVQGHFGTGGTNASLRKVNKWNEEKMFFRAFLDKDGDPAIEQDLIVKHGVTRRTVKEFVSLMELGIRAFVSEVCE